MENILREVSADCESEEAFTKTDISFTDFVKLYINHRHVFGTTEHMMKFAFQTILDITSTSNTEGKNFFSRLQFVPLLEQAGKKYIIHI